MAFSPAALADRLENEGEKTRAYFSNLEEEEWSRPIYSTGPAWDLSQILAHFITAEQAFQVLIHNIRSGGPGAYPGFDIDAFNQEAVAAVDHLLPGMLLEQFAVVRRATVELVRDLQEEDLSRQGRHPFLGETSLLEMIKLIYRHNQIHLREVRQTGV